MIIRPLIKENNNFFVSMPFEIFVVTYQSTVIKAHHQHKQHPVSARSLMLRQNPCVWFFTADIFRQKPTTQFMESHIKANKVINYALSVCFE